MGDTNLESHGSHAQCRRSDLRGICLADADTPRLHQRHDSKIAPGATGRTGPDPGHPGRTDDHAYGPNGRARLGSLVAGYLSRAVEIRALLPIYTKAAPAIRLLARFLNAF